MSATPESESARLMRVATWASVATAGFLIVIKLVAWGATGSMAVLSTLIDSVLDAAASVVNLLAVRHALQPADREHRFGHGKAEPLAGLGQAAFIAGSGLFLVIEATQRIAHPEPIERGWLGIGVMIVSIVLTMLLVRFQRQVVARTDSVAIGADSLHYAGDVLINLSVIVSLGLAMTLGWHFADPIFAVAIAAYLVWNAWAIAQDSLNLLMDREFPDEDRQRIKALCLANPGVRSMHDLRTRSSGQQGFIQLHLELDAEMSLRDAHAIADEVEGEIRAAFPNAEVIIHQDPAGITEERRSFG
ncbi:MAG: cation diffusion facilitator family transporter [Alphaproteobacteria bacterium]|nr:cation diffusion facilitator family transporter [Alphaproteobacteria bacterium]